MDFLNWIGTAVRDGTSWLFSKDGIAAASSAYDAFGKSNKPGTSSSRTGGIMERQAALYGSSNPGRAVASQTRPAAVVGKESRLFSNRADSDPWMGMFRRMLTQRGSGMQS